MANELSLQLSLNFSKDSAAYNKTANQQVGVDTADFNAGTLSASTSDAEIALSGVTTPGYVYIRNLDTGTETLDIECTNATSDPASYSITLEPSEFCLFRAKHAYIHYVGSAADVPFEFAIIED